MNFYYTTFNGCCCKCNTNNNIIIDSTTTRPTTVCINCKSKQIEYAILTKNIWSLRSLALSYNGLINDTYRQQVWPILLEQQKTIVVPKVIEDQEEIETKTTEVQWKAQQQQQQHVSPLVSPNSKGTNTKINATKNVPVVSVSVSSPCTVMIGNDELDNDDDHDEYYNDNVRRNNKDTDSNNNDTSNDIRIMWYDLQRWYPTSSSSSSVSSCSSNINIDTFRQLIAYTITESLQIQSSVIISSQTTTTTTTLLLRYYQGYHILAANILSTLIGNNNSNNNNESHTSLPVTDDVVSYATKDTIHTLQQLIYKIPYLYYSIVELNDENTLYQSKPFSYIVQYISQYIIPLYYYYTTIKNITKEGNHNNDNNNESNGHEMEEQMIALCIPWLLTLFGTTTNECSSSGQRYLDVVFASNVTYFPIYLCVSKLLFHHYHYHCSTNNHTACTTTTNKEIFNNNTTKLCCITECIIHHAIQIMEEIPPHILHTKVQLWYHHNHYDNTNYYDDDKLVLSIPLSIIMNPSSNTTTNNDLQHQPSQNSNKIATVLRFIQFMYYYCRYTNTVITLGMTNYQWYTIQHRYRRLRAKKVIKLCLIVLKYLLRLSLFTMSTSYSILITIISRTVSLYYHYYQHRLHWYHIVKQRRRQLLRVTMIATKIVLSCLFEFIANVMTLSFTTLQTIGTIFITRTIHTLLLLSSQYGYNCLFLTSKQQRNFASTVSPTN